MGSILLLTGRTVTKMVASSATMSEMIERLIMMNHSFFSGFHSPTELFSFSISRSDKVEEVDSCGVTVPKKPTVEPILESVGCREEIGDGDLVVIFVELAI